MDKQIETKVAVGAILLLAIIIGGMVWLKSLIQSKRLVSQPPTNIHQTFNGTHSLNGLSTVEAYNKALSLIGNEENVTLKRILINEHNSASLNTVTFAFTIDTQVITVDYNFSNKNVQITGRGDLTKDIIAKVPDLDSSYPEIPQYMITTGAEGAWQFLIRNADYNKYKKQNPDVFQKYEITSSFDGQYGWEWTFLFMITDTNGQSIKRIAFAVNPTTKNVRILVKQNLNE